MKRLVMSLMVLGLVIGAVATAEANRPRKRVERTVEGSYISPWLPWGTSICAQSGGTGCVTIATGAREAFLTAKVTDAHGQPVFVLVRGESDGQVVDLGTFCGETVEPISFDPGAKLEFLVGLAWIEPTSCLPGTATTGTVKVTLSNLS